MNIEWNNITFCSLYNEYYNNNEIILFAMIVSEYNAEFVAYDTFGIYSTQTINLVLVRVHFIYLKNV